MPTLVPSITEMSSKQLEAMLAATRDRRLRLFHEYEEKRKAIMNAQTDKLTSAMIRRVDAIRKKFEAIDAKLDTLAADIAKLRALELQLEDIGVVR